MAERVIENLTASAPSVHSSKLRDGHLSHDVFDASTTAELKSTTQQSKDCNNNNSKISADSQSCTAYTATTADPNCLLRSKVADKGCPGISIKPSTSTPRSKSSSFYTIPYLSNQSLSTSFEASSPPYWHPLFQRQRRCSADMVDIALRGAVQKHSLFTPPRVNSPDSDIAEPLQRPSSCYNVMDFMACIEREVGMELRMVSDNVNLKQTGLCHGYQVQEHPSVLYNRTFSRSFPGAPAVARLVTGDDIDVGCHGFKRNKERLSTRSILGS